MEWKPIYMQQQSLYPDILLPIAGGHVFIKTEEIVYMEANGSYTNIYLQDGRQTRISKKLKATLEVLTPKLFVRIHHSYIIGLTHIAKLVNGESTLIQMKNGTELPLSRSRKAEFLQKFKRL